MDDLRRRFEALDWIETPYQWLDIEARVRRENRTVRSPGLHGPLLGLATAAAVLLSAVGFAAGQWLPGLSAALRWAFGGAGYPRPVTPDDVSVLATAVAGTAGASVLAAAGAAFVWRWMSRSLRSRRSMIEVRGGGMQTMSETAEEHISGEVARTNRWRRLSMVVLLAAIVAAGTWLLVDNLVKSDIEALIEDYGTAWETNDPALLRSVVTDDYTLRDLRDGTDITLEGIDTELGLYEVYGFTMEARGELIVNGTMASQSQTVSFRTDTFEGFSVFEIEDGKISRHVLVFVERP